MMPTCESQLSYNVMNNPNRYSVTATLLTAVILLALSACGLKGDLYLATPEGKAEDTTETLPPMPAVDTSMDDTGSSVIEDLEAIESLDTTESKDTDVLDDAPAGP